MSDPNSNRSIEYFVKCSDAMGIEEEFRFHQHTVPSSLCRQITQSTNEEKAQISVLIFDVIKTHDNEIFQARSWSCVECNRPATTLIHNAMLYLHLDKPQIIDYVAPCCTKKPCDTQIRSNFSGLMGIFGIPSGMP